MVCADSDLNQPAAGKGIAADTVDMDVRQAPRGPASFFFTPTMVHQLTGLRTMGVGQ